jgi:D-lyxose ketol-isomerase
MLTRRELAEARGRAAEIFVHAGIALTDAERSAIEIADFGLSKLEETGLEIVVYGAPASAV